MPNVAEEAAGALKANPLEAPLPDPVAVCCWPNVGADPTNDVVVPNPVLGAAVAPNEAFGVLEEPNPDVDGGLKPDDEVVDWKLKPDVDVAPKPVG